MQKDYRITRLSLQNSYYSNKPQAILVTHETIPPQYNGPDDDIIVLSPHSLKAFEYIHSDADFKIQLIELYQKLFKLYLKAKNGNNDFNPSEEAILKEANHYLQQLLVVDETTEQYKNIASSDLRSIAKLLHFNDSKAIIKKKTSNHLFNLFIDLLNLSRNQQTENSPSNILSNIKRISYFSSRPIDIESKRIVFALFNLTRDRVNTLLKTLKHFESDKLDLKISVILLGEKLDGLMPQFSNVDFVYIQDHDNEGLWQKETLYNLASGLHPLTKYFCFIDSDTHPRDLKKWNDSIDNLIAQNYDAIQAYSHISSDSPLYDQFSYLYAKSKSIAPCFGHGLAWVFSHDFLHRIDYLNARMIDGANDTVFLYEMNLLDTNFDYLKNLSRIHIGDSKVTFIEHEMIHLSYAQDTYRNYANRQKLIEMFNGYESLHQTDLLGLQQRIYNLSFYRFLKKWTTHDFFNYGDFYNNCLELSSHIHSGVISAKPSASIELENKKVFITSPDSLLSIFEDQKRCYLYTHALSQGAHSIRIDFQLPFNSAIEKLPVAALNFTCTIFGDNLDHAYLELFDKQNKKLIDSNSKILPFKSFTNESSVSLNFKRSFNIDDYDQIGGIALYTTSKSNGFFSIEYTIDEIPSPASNFSVIKRDNFFDKCSFYTMNKPQDIFTYVYRSDQKISIKNVPSHLYQHPFTTGLSLHIKQKEVNDFSHIKVSVISTSSDSISIPVDVNDPGNNYEKLVDTQILQLNPLTRTSSFTIEKQKIDDYFITFALESSDYRTFSIEDILVEYLK